MHLIALDTEEEEYSSANGFYDKAALSPTKQVRLSSTLLCVS